MYTSWWNNYANSRFYFRKFHILVENIKLLLFGIISEKLIKSKSLRDAQSI